MVLASCVHFSFKLQSPDSVHFSFKFQSPWGCSSPFCSMRGMWLIPVNRENKQRSTTFPSTATRNTLTFRNQHPTTPSSTFSHISIYHIELNCSHRAFATEIIPPQANPARQAPSPSPREHFWIPLSPTVGFSQSSNLNNRAESGVL